MKHIYELHRIDICGQRYPRRRTYLVSMGYFSTQKLAVEKMQNFIADFTNYDYDSNHSTWLGFIITKYAVDKEVRATEPLYQCTYTHAGIFNDENLAGEDGIFRGRPADRVRYTKGDIVEVYDGDASLGIVYGTPLSPERCTQLSTPDERGRFCSFDRSDDQYTILFLAGNTQSDTEEPNFTHDHLQSQFLFQPTKPIPSTLINRLKAIITND